MSRPRGSSRRFTRTDLALGGGLALVGAASLLIIGGDETAGEDRAPDALGYGSSWPRPWS